MNAGGVLWWTTQKAIEQLQVDRKRLNDWVRRSKAAGHIPGRATLWCPGCGRARAGGVFPHIDPPVRRGRTAGYKADQLLEAESYTAASARGGVSRAVT